MRDLISVLRTFGGAAPRHTLYAHGFTQRQLQQQVMHGSLLRIGRQWLALPTVDPSVVTALRAGGILGGGSALRSYGIWVTEQTRIVDVATVPHSSKKQFNGIRRVWHEHAADADPWRVTVADALWQYLQRAGRLDAIATLDSALYRGQLDLDGLAALRDRAPERCRPWFDLVDPRAESGTESIVRVSGLDHGWTVEPQVPFEGGRLDTVFEGWLCVECDSREHHSGLEQYDRDHRRNQNVLRAGGRWHRVTHFDVIHDLERTMQLISQILSQGHPTRLRFG